MESNESAAFVRVFHRWCGFVALHECIRSASDVLVHCTAALAMKMLFPLLCLLVSLPR